MKQNNKKTTGAVCVQRVINARVVSSWIVSLTVLHAPYTGLGHTHSRIKTATFLFVTFYIIRRPSIENQHATFWNEYALTFSACNEWWQSPNSADIASLQTIIEMSLVWTEQVVSTKRKVERSQLRIKYVANVCFFFFQKKKKRKEKERNWNKLLALLDSAGRLMNTEGGEIGYTPWLLQATAASSTSRSLPSL